MPINAADPEGPLYGRHQERTGTGIVNELVKSYGFSRTSDGRWDWSVETIGKSFKEDPFWTTFDYLALAAPVLKWGSAVKAVRGGVGAVGAGLKVGRFTGKQASSKTGRFVGNIVGQDVAAAAEMYSRGPSRILGGRLANPITTKIDDDYRKLIDEFGAAPWEKRGLESMVEREKLLMANYFERTTSDTQKQFQRATRGMGDAQKGFAMRRAARFLEEGVEPGDAIVSRAFQGNAKLKQAYQNTWTFRNAIHNESYRLGLISKEAYKANLKTYNPRIYEEFVRLEEASTQLSKVTGEVARKSGDVAGGTARFMPRKHAKGTEALTQILDPRASLNELGKAGAIISKQFYAQRLAGSVIAKTADEVAGSVDEILGGNKVLQKLHGISNKKLDAVRRMVDGRTGLNRDVIHAEVADELGWKTLDRIFESTGRKVPGYLERLPDELRGKLIDPTVANDVLGVLKFADNDDWMMKFYKGALAWFRTSKTAYNLATHFRNYFGGIVFHHLATGGVPKRYPRKGIQSFLAQDESYKAAIESGLVGSSFTAEIREALEQSYGVVDKLGKQASGFDWMGGSAAARYVQKGASQVENFYRATDEVWKLDAWIERTKYWTKSGLDPKAARAEALLDVNKYMPTFIQHGDVANFVRQHVPFFSFTTEALRIWKNALSEKPHLAFFWSHMADGMSQTFGAMAGFDTDQLEAAKDALPSHVNNKQLLALPFDVDGKPMFLDLSYQIPLANLVEGADGESMFFGELVNPIAANPVFNIAAAAATGKDPFSGRPVEPRFTERQLGVAVPQAAPIRKAVGIAEHIAQVALPPLMPPGYVGTNLLEFARGQRHPQSGELLEEGALRTILANLAGLRGYAATTEAQVQNVRREQQKTGEKVSQAWNRWGYAKANGNPRDMEREVERILALKRAEGHDDPEGYVRKGIIRHEPGKFTGFSTKQLEKIIQRTRRIGTLSSRDRRILSELTSRYQSRRNR